MKDNASKRIHIFTLGGTIAYTDSGLLKGEDLIKNISEHKSNSNITITSFKSKPSSSLRFNEIIELSKEIKRIAETGIDGVVITLGTDVIEEVAFILDLLITDIPLVITGAMRNPLLYGNDGAMNLLHAITLAESSLTKNEGAVVVMNNEIHSAKFVRKTHTQSIEAFTSEFGSIGFFGEGEPYLMMKSKFSNPIDFIDKKDNVQVLLYAVTFDDDGRMLNNALELGYNGIIIEGLGGGHVPENMVPILREIAKEIPIVLATRLETGMMLKKTYRGYPGSETALLNDGLISAGWLNSNKARTLLYLLLRSNRTIKEIEMFFSNYSNSLYKTVGGN